MTLWIEHAWPYWQSGGILLLPIALISFGIWGYFLRSRTLILRVQREGAAVIQFLQQSEPNTPPAILNHRANSLAGGVAAMLRAFLQDIQNGAAGREAFENRSAECMDLLRRDCLILGALTAVAPLLGLLGTVMGMVDTFDAVAQVSGDTGSRVADGISQALITTQFGLVVAVPGVFGIARLQRLLQNTEVLFSECRAHAMILLEAPKRRISS